MCIYHITSHHITYPIISYCINYLKADFGPYDLASCLTVRDAMTQLSNLSESRIAMGDPVQNNTY